MVFMKQEKMDAENNRQYAQECAPLLTCVWSGFVHRWEL